MPTQNPVTRFGRGFHGFAPQPRVTRFGPYEGDPNAPKGSTKYNLWRDGYYDNMGKPHQPGDIALSPDLAKKYRYGQIVTEHGVTGRFAGTTNERLRNTVDVWQAKPGPIQTGKQSTEPNLPTGPGADRGPGLLKSERPSIEIANVGPQRPSVEINAGETPGSRFRERGNPYYDWAHDWDSEGIVPPPDYVSPSWNNEDVGSLAGGVPSGGGKSPQLITDPNEDWIGAEPSGNVASNTQLFTNPDAGNEAVSPTLSGETLLSLPNSRYETAAARPGESPISDVAGSYVDAIYPETVAQEPWQTQNFYDASGNNWWSEPQSQSEMTAADRGEGRSVFGAADTATGQSWDTLAGGSEEGSHAFEFIGADDSPLVAETSYPPPQSESNTFPDAEYPPPQPEPSNFDTVYTDPEPDELLAREEQPPGNIETDPGLFVRRGDLDMSGSSNNLPTPNLASFGMSPFSATRTGSAYVGGNVGGGLVRYANNLNSYTPGDEPGTADINAPATPEAEANFKAAEERGNAERAQERGTTQNASTTQPGGSLTPTQYNQQTFGGLRGVGYVDRSGSETGYGASIGSQENAKLMAFMSFGGNPNRPMADEARELRGNNRRSIDPITGELTRVSPPHAMHRGETAWSRLLTTPAGRARALHLTQQQSAALAGHG